MKCRKCFREIDDNKEYCNDCYLKYCEDVPLEIRKQQEIIEYLIDWMLFNKNKKYFEDNINIIVDNNNRNKIINPNDLHFKQNQQIVLKQAKTIQNKMLVYKNKISYSKPEINQEVEKNIITKEDIPKKIHKKEKNQSSKMY